MTVREWFIYTIGYYKAYEVMYRNGYLEHPTPADICVNHLIDLGCPSKDAWDLIAETDAYVISMETPTSPP